MNLYNRDYVKNSSAVQEMKLYEKVLHVGKEDDDASSTMSTEINDKGESISQRKWVRL